MSSTTLKPLPSSKPGQGPQLPSAIAPSNHSVLLEKLNRRSTPDSEALASDDDEGESHRQEPLPSIAHHPKPARRSSWLNDTSPSISQPPGLPRKGSFAGTSMSPTASHPTTPSTDAGTWGPTPAAPMLGGRAHTGSSFAWGTGIWNNDRKEPPSRLTEVLASPTSMLPPGAGQGVFFPTDVATHGSPGPRDAGTSSQIPFPIPLHPTPKTYRSQSYSVGQLDADTPSAMPTSALHSSGRRGIPGLQHRPSRPSMLSEMSNELGNLKEVDDDEEEEGGGSILALQHQNSENAKTIEHLARENAMLRQQQQQQQQLQNQQNRLRPRASTSYGLGNGYSTVPEESDYAIEELDESGEAPGAAPRSAITRRMSEYASGSTQMNEYGSTGAQMRTAQYAPENRNLENVKKASWQSSLGFSGLGDGSQSRRHSFADVPVPTRQGSISSMSDAVLAAEPNTLSQEPQQMQEYGGYGASGQSYFGGGQGATTAVNPQQALGCSAYPNTYQQAPYAQQSQYSHRPASPHRAIYGLTQPRPNQPLFMVLFKCARADAFFIQDGTGLSVKPGDLVIVEADRGTDLGTVARDNIDWQTAKDLKEHYAEEHYKWLMMYSQNAAAAQEGGGTVGGFTAAPNGHHGGMGGMGPTGPQHQQQQHQQGMQEPNPGELKPKLIKRLAQAHEVHSLREKEGNEAKAKRVCMQKVKEHGLNMEILDAEFQMDWKKLTFYYFADSYINFNSLVTDLFKIYKTRIWMSAVNPASFASPTLGLQAPSGIGPGAVGVGRGAGNSERRQNQVQEQASAYSTTASGGRGFQGGLQPSFPQSYGNDRPVAPGAPYQQGGYYTGSNQYGGGGPGVGGGAFGNHALSRGAGNTQYAQQGMMDSYHGGFAQGSEMASLRTAYAGSQGASPDPGLGGQGGGEWVGQFQGLSLNTR